MTSTPWIDARIDIVDDRCDPAFEALAADLTSRMADGADAITDIDFNNLALRVFGYQFEHNDVYRAFCQRRLATPDDVVDWTEIPAVPTTAFKQLTLISGQAVPSEAVFRTSGTTQSRRTRGTHHVRDLRLYHAAVSGNYRAHLLPEGQPIRTLSLIPSPDDQPESSLSHMVGHVMSLFADDESDYFVSVRNGLDPDRFHAAAQQAIEQEVPVAVVGSAFAFVHLADMLFETGRSVTLPPGSRIMETGGFKGRSRELSRAGLYELLGRSLGVAADWIVNEYGMTELLSQFYDGVAGHATPVHGATTEGTRVHRPPPWVRTRVLDPVTLRPVGDGGIGILSHIDLANLGTVCALLTEDLGVARADGFEVVGRTPEAEPRGCSIAMDDLLAAIEPEP